MSNKPISKKENVPIPHKQIESFLKAIPPGWTITFNRTVLRPDILQMALIRPDRLQYQLRTTGAMLLENPDKDFLEAIATAVNVLSKAKKENIKK